MFLVKWATLVMLESAFYLSGSALVPLVSYSRGNGIIYLTPNVGGKIIEW